MQEELNSQIDPRYIGSFTTWGKRSSSFMIDMLKTPDFGCVTSPVAEQLNSIPLTTMTTSAWIAGSTLVYDLPVASVPIVGEMFISVALSAATTSTYCPWVGLCMIETVDIMQSGNQIMTYDYQTVLDDILSRLCEEDRQLILACAGSPTNNAGTYIIPIPSFWSKLINIKDGVMQDTQPLLAHLISSSSIQIRLKLRGGAHCLAATSTAPVINGVPSLYYQSFIVPPEEIMRQKKMYSDSYTFKSIDFQVVSRPAIATATETSIDLSSIKTKVRSLTIESLLASDVSTAHAWYNNQVVDTFSLDVDSRPCFYKLDSRATSRYYDFILGESSGTPSSSTSIGEIGGRIQFCIDHDTRIISGFLAFEKFGVVTLKLTHSAGANCDVKVLAMSECAYIIEHGILRRLT